MHPSGRGLLLLPSAPPSLLRRTLADLFNDFSFAHLPSLELLSVEAIMDYRPGHGHCDLRFLGPMLSTLPSPNSIRRVVVHVCADDTHQHSTVFDRHFLYLPYAASSAVLDRALSQTSKLEQLHEVNFISTLGSSRYCERHSSPSAVKSGLSKHICDTLFPRLAFRKIIS